MVKKLLPTFGSVVGCYDSAKVLFLDNNSAGAEPRSVDKTLKCALGNKKLSIIEKLK